jgi:hypothetical protein
LIRFAGVGLRETHVNVWETDFLFGLKLIESIVI